MAYELRSGRPKKEYTPRMGRPRSSRKPKQPVTAHLYQRLLEWFRDNPTVNYTAAAKHAGCNFRTAKRAYEIGWPKRRKPLKPIRDLLKAENAEARAERARHNSEIARREAQQMQDAHNDAVRTRLEEGFMVQSARTVAGRLLGQTIKMVEVGDQIASELVAQIQGQLLSTETDEFGDPKVSAKQKFDILERIQAYAGNSAKLAEVAINLERKFMGEPDQVIRHEHQMSPGEAVNELLESSRSLVRAVTVVGAADGEVIDAEVTDPVVTLLEAKMGDMTPDQIQAILEEEGLEPVEGE